MKILVIHPHMNILGGGERICFHILKVLLMRGDDITLISNPIDPKKIEKFIGFNILNSIKLIAYPKFRPKVKKFLVYQRLLHHILSKIKLKNKIEKFDVELLTQDVVFMFDVGKNKITYVHYPAFLMHLEKTPKVKLFWKAYYAPFKYYSKKQIENIDFFICNSRFTKNRIKEEWNKDARIIYPPVNIKEFKPATEKENTIITLGRFVPFKNYEVINEVAKFLPEVKFKIIGIKQDIGYYEKIKRTKPKNVFLLTNLTRSEVISELSKAKVYLHTTIGEHFGIAIVEAMASGCIPVVHNSGGAPEVIGDLGHVYNDNKECVDKIREALNADISLNKLVERAKMFDSERFEKEILNLFNKIA